MSQTILTASSLTVPVGQLIALLERYRDHFPFLDEELARQRVLAQTVADQGVRSDEALSAWRTALAQRWECEVAAQRAYSAAQRLLSEHYGAEDTYAQLLASTSPGDARTPAGLLQEVRRLEASLELLAPQPDFAANCRAHLMDAARRLEATINLTRRCEVERRAILAEQRVVANLIEQAYERSRRLLALHALADDLSPPERAAEAELAA